MTPTRVRSLAGLAVASAVLLTGCGSVPAFNPGVAARVGDDTITLDAVDDLTATYCAAAEEQLQEGQALPNHYLRGQVAGSLALRSAAEQLAAEYDVEPDRQYAEAVAQAEQSLQSLDAEQRDALIEVQGTSVFVNAVQLSVGRRVLSDRGRFDTGVKAATAAGKRTFVDWLADQDVRIDPRFGIGIETGETVPVDTSVSYALGETATRAGADQPDTEYAAGLPAAQRCG